MKKFTSTALTAILALSLAGCSSASNEGGSTAAGGDKILRYGLSGIKGTFNSIISDTVYDNYVVTLTQEALVTADPTGAYVPLIADWELSEDNLTYTFTLKDGVAFSDGTPVTAEDVAFTFNTIKEPDYAGPRSAVGADIANIEVIDEKTVAFTMNNASPANIADFTYGILSKEYYAHSSFEELAALNNAPFGSGPFVLTGYANKQYVTLEKNQNYWDPEFAAKIDGIEMLEISDDTVLSALAAQEIDMCMPAAKAENVQEIESMQGIAHLKSYLGNGYTFMCFNTTLPQLGQTEVRQALLYALDRKTFLTQEYGSDQLVSLGMAPLSPVSWAYPDGELNEYAFDIEKANAMLDAAGWTDRVEEKADDGTTVQVRAKDGVTMDLDWLVYTDSTWPQTLSGMAFDSWKQIGVNLHIKQHDFNTVATMVNDTDPAERTFAIYTMGFSLGLDPDPTGGLFDYDAYRQGGFCASGWNNPRAQELIKLGKEEFDQAKRADYYKEWATIMLEDVPVKIIAYRSEIWGINDRVHGFEAVNSFASFANHFVISNITLD